MKLDVRSWVGHFYRKLTIFISSEEYPKKGRNSTGQHFLETYSQDLWNLRKMNKSLKKRNVSQWTKTLQGQRRTYNLPLFNEYLHSQNENRNSQLITITTKFQIYYTKISRLGWLFFNHFPRLYVLTLARIIQIFFSRCKGITIRLHLHTPYI